MHTFKSTNVHCSNKQAQYFLVFIVKALLYSGQCGIVPITTVLHVSTIKVRENIFNPTYRAVHRLRRQCGRHRHGVHVGDLQVLGDPHAGVGA